MTAPTHEGLIAGRYQLVAPLGGETATVYRGLDVLLDRDVAVKRLTPPAIDEAEARATARIRHPGVAAIYDLVSGDPPYIVTELVEGRSLADVVAEQGPMAPDQVADIGRQLLAALVAGHVVGVLHRDLKPANVLIRPDGQAVLTDFGIAATGTPGYTAPERADGQPATPAADLWSLGATLYTALCGASPSADLGEGTGEDPVAGPGEGPVPEVVSALLRRDPAARPSFAEIARALDVPAGPARMPPPAQPRPQPRRSQPRPRRERDTRTDTAAAVRPDRTGRISLILAAVAAAAIAASAVAAYLPGARHDAQSTAQSPAASAGAGGQPGAAGSARALTGPVAPPPVGQQFRVAATADASGRPEVIARQANGTLAASRFASGSWSAWTTLPGGPAYTANPAVVTAKDGRLVVFARAATGQVAEIWQTAPGSTIWAGPMPLGTTVVRSSPAAVAWPDGHLEVFALLNDGHIGYMSQSSTTGGGTWTDWTSLGGPVTGPPATALDATGHPQVFAATAGRQLVRDYLAGGSWAGWTQAPGQPRYVGVPGIAMSADGRLEVFARSTNGDLLHVWQSARSGAGWSGPADLVVNGCSTDPAVFSAAGGAHGGHLEAFCMDSTFGDSVFHTFQTSAGAETAWSPWQSLKGSSDGAVTALQTPTFTGILVRTSTGAIAYRTWTVQRGWSGWFTLPSS